MFVDVHACQSRTPQEYGVQKTDGDGTVPLISMGLMCRNGWRGKTKLNPSGMRVVTKEYSHKTVPMYQDIRWAPFLFGFLTAFHPWLPKKHDASARSAQCCLLFTLWKAGSSKSSASLELCISQR